MTYTVQYLVYLVEGLTLSSHGKENHSALDHYTVHAKWVHGQSLHTQTTTALAGH